MHRHAPHMSTGGEAATASKCDSSPTLHHKRPPARHMQRPTLRNLNPVFHRRAKSEDTSLVSEKLIKTARRSGTLNLSSRGLATAAAKRKYKELTSFCMCGPYPRRRYYHIREFRMMPTSIESENEDTHSTEIISSDIADKNEGIDENLPDKVYDLNEGDQTTEVTLESLCIKEEDAWWNEVPLTNLDLSSNQLLEISPKIEKLCSLTTLTLYDNALVSVPMEIAKLEKLVRLNLSRNKLKDLPREFYTLPNLRYLNLSYNNFEHLDPDISDLHMLEFLDVSNNQLKSLPGGIGFLVRITTLLLNHNHLKELPSDLVNMRSLQKLDLMHNDLVALPQDIGTLRKLQCLYVQHNDINALPDFDGCNNLQELHVSNNFIKKVPQRLCSNLPHLKILDLRDNKIVKLPDEISLLQNLTRLDVSNNSLTNLPNSLATLAHLISLQVEGNPIKTIRRDILQCGTVRILKTLRDRALSQEPVAKGSTSSISSNSDSCNMGGDGLNSPRGILPEVEDSIFPDKYKLRKTHCLTVTMQQLTDVPRDIFEMASHENVQMVDFSRNRLNTLPDGLHEMKNVVSELIFANNLITYVPAFISQFTRVTLINLSCNNLSTLPHEFGVLNTLRELNVSHNRFESMPKCVYELQGLEILLACDNRIKSIDASENGFGAMKRLATLDLRNNDIDQVPPILGNLKNITTLEIIGNPFKLPRHQTLEKGTEAIMSYLRDRIPA